MDKVALLDIVKNLNGKPLSVSNYTLSLMKKFDFGNYCTLEKNCTFFYEVDDLFGMEEFLDKVIIYFWNRKYPSDKKLKLDLTRYIIICTYEFVGSSHENITKVIYERK